MAENRIAKLLAGGARQSLGAAPAVAAMVLEKPALFDDLFECLFVEDPIVRGRAACALIRLLPEQAKLFQPYKDILLTEIAAIPQWEVRTQVCKILVRLRLTKQDRAAAYEIFESYLDDRSSIVRTTAMQALADLAFLDPALKSDVTDRIEEKMRTGTAAMRARGKKLLKALRDSSENSSEWNQTPL